MAERIVMTQRRDVWGEGMVTEYITYFSTEVDDED
jgi:hypothetical protein